MIKYKVDICYFLLFTYYTLKPMFLQKYSCQRSYFYKFFTGFFVILTTIKIIDIVSANKIASNFKTEIQVE